MAELERLANHFGDIGAICNDASFSLMLAHCAVLREKVLRFAGAAFGHRLMMDAIVPGGVAVDLTAEAAASVRALVAEIRDAFPRLVNLYDNTASLQDRTVGTGTLSAALARQYAAGGYIGRASGRSFDTRRAIPYPPYDELSFDVPVREEGDVNARVWIRIREVEQSLALIEEISREAARKGRSAVDAAGRRRRRARARRGLSRRRARLAPRRRGRPRRALPSPRSVMVPVAAPRSGDRGQHRRRLPALQQILQLLLFGPRPLTAMRKLLFQGIVRSPLTEPAPAADDADLAALAASLERASRRRLGRSLSIREVDAGSCNGCELEIHALNNAFYDLERFGLRFVASPRHADVLLVTGPVTKNMREALERTYAATPDRRNGWSRSATAPSTAASSPAPTRSPAASRRSFRSICIIRGCPPSPTALLKGLLALLQSADAK